MAVLFADALGDNPGTAPGRRRTRYPDVDGRLALPPNQVGRAEAIAIARGGRDARVSPNQVGRAEAIAICQRAGRGRVHVFDVENHDGTPVYVHAKVCVVDDIWAGIGSDNFNRRSWTHDRELSCSILDSTVDERLPKDPAGEGDQAVVSPDPAHAVR
ncbi:MAG: phospholipase D-like domain-containing protein [Geodermatophilaceae bacterium]